MLIILNGCCVVKKQVLNKGVWYLSFSNTRNNFKDIETPSILRHHPLRKKNEIIYLDFENFWIQLYLLWLSWGIMPFRDLCRISSMYISILFYMGWNKSRGNFDEVFFGLMLKKISYTIIFKKILNSHSIFTFLFIFYYNSLG